MPLYDMQCNSRKSHTFEQYMTFAEFDGSKATGVWPICPKCQSQAKLVVPDEPPDISIAKTDNVGKIAEINSKKLGKFGVEDTTIAEQKRRKPIKERKKAPWYGDLGTKKTKEIFGEKDKKKQKEKINKYVIHGE
jgi:hypothetical protein